MVSIYISQFRGKVNGMAGFDNLREKVRGFFLFLENGCAEEWDEKREIYAFFSVLQEAGCLSVGNCTGGTEPKREKALEEAGTESGK